MAPDLAFAAHEQCSLRPGYRGTSLQSFHARFPSDEACLRHILESSTEDLSTCKKCGKAAKLYSIRGTRRFQYRQMSLANLPALLGEVEFRYNRRHSTLSLFDELITRFEYFPAGDLAAVGGRYVWDQGPEP